MVDDHLIEHIGVPDTRTGRSEKTSIILDDFEALYLQRQLRVYSEYEARGTLADVAEGYSQLIDEHIRERGEKFMPLFIGTDTAFEAVAESLETAETKPDELAQLLYDRVMDEYDVPVEQ